MEAGGFGGGSPAGGGPDVVPCEVEFLQLELVSGRCHRLNGREAPSVPGPSLSNHGRRQKTRYFTHVKKNMKKNKTKLLEQPGDPLWARQHRHIIPGTASQASKRPGRPF